MNRRSFFNKIAVVLAVMPFIRPESRMERNMRARDEGANSPIIWIRNHALYIQKGNNVEWRHLSNFEAKRGFVTIAFKDPDNPQKLYLTRVHS